MERGLTRRVLPLAGGDHVTHDALVDERRIDPGSAHGLAHGNGAELGRGEILEGSEKFTGGRAGRRDDDCLAHAHENVRTRRAVTALAPSRTWTRWRMVGAARSTSVAHRASF